MKTMTARKRKDTPQEEADTYPRAIVLPVSGPVNMTWEEAREIYQPSLVQACQLSNWLVRQVK